ncbi:MAG: undecaprenyl-diphosphatase UppP [Patescibacteria group bacterium]|jgi:undecaprenyl-diphosphatase
MSYIFSIVYGFVQGVTEFLPVSSTGHLVVLHAIWRLPIADDLGFDAILHLGTFAALLFYFWSDIVKYVRAIAVGLGKRDARGTDWRLGWLLILGTIPAVLLGLIFESYVDTTFRSLWVVVVALAIGAVFFFWLEKVSRQTKDIDRVTPGSAIAIGVGQAIALIPGISRSGSTIITGLAFGLKREAAARFAFLLAIPITLGAGTKKTLDVVQTHGFGQHWLVYALGVAASAVSGYFCIRFFLRYLNNRSLRPFGWYRLALAVLLAILLLSGVLQSGMAQHVAG